MPDRDNPPTFPDVFYEVIREGVIAREEGEPDKVLGCTVVGTCLIRERKARSVVEFHGSADVTDEDLINAARPGIDQAFRELAASTS